MNPNVLLAIVLLPLGAAIIAGLFGRRIGRVGAHTVTIGAVGVSFILSCIVLKQILVDGAPTYNAPVYTWLVSDGIAAQVGFLVDRLTALMMVVVTFVSFCVHVYTIGYMVAFNRESGISAEAAMKYFVLGAIASGTLLYGISIIYGVTGSFALDDVARALNESSASDVGLLFGVAFIVVGVAFKFGAVPFHMSPTGRSPGRGPR